MKQIPMPTDAEFLAWGRWCKVDLHMPKYSLEHVNGTWQKGSAIWRCKEAPDYNVLVRVDR